MATKLKWKFPAAKFFFLRIEVVVISILALLIFLLTIANFGGFIIPVLLTAVFLGLYGGISYIIQMIRLAEESYMITPTHLHVTRKTRRTLKKDKVPLKSIKSHKLDKTFLGGYVLTHKKKHVLFFNSLDEMEKFENLVKKHSKPQKRKKKR